MKESLENRIMGYIKGGRVKLKSKYAFLAEKLSLGSGLVLTILLATLFFSITLFYMKETDNLIYLTFGLNGFLAFLESFPYLLIISLVILIFLAGFLITKTDLSYKKSFGEWSLCLVVFIVIIGSSLVFTNINKELEEHHQMLIHPFFEKRLPLGKGMAGTVMERREKEIILNTIEGPQYVNLKYIKHYLNFNKNDLIVIIGDKRNDGFYASDFKVIKDPNEMFLMKVRLKKDPGLLDKKCISECLDKGNLIRNCFDDCMHNN